EPDRLWIGTRDLVEHELGGDAARGRRARCGGRRGAKLVECGVKVHRGVATVGRANHAAGQQRCDDRESHHKSRSTPTPNVVAMVEFVKLVKMVCDSVARR